MTYILGGSLIFLTTYINLIWDLNRDLTTYINLIWDLNKDNSPNSTIIMKKFLIKTEYKQHNMSTLVFEQVCLFLVDKMGHPKKNSILMG